jgi:hypothetical protein
VAHQLTVALGLPLLVVASSAVAQPACVEDAALGRAALTLLADGPPYGDPTDAARGEGSDAPFVEARLVTAEASRAPWVAAFAASRPGAPVACGEARTASRRLLLLAPRRGALEPAGEGRFRVVLAPGWRAPRLFALHEDAVPEIREVRVGDVLGPYERPARLQLVAEGPEGQMPVAERTVGALEVVGVRTGSLRDALRSLREGPALRPNRLLDELAEAHAERVCEEGVARHGDPESRLAEAGVQARHVGEVVARARGREAAVRRLLASPSHRAVMLDRRFTDLGVAEVEGDGQSCVVALFAAWPRRVR